MNLLRWEMKRDGSWWAHSGKLIIGYVTVRMDGTVGYSVTAVSTKYVTKGYGDVGSIKYGKKAVERAWRQWLEAAGLVCPKGVDREAWEMGLVS